MGGGGLSNERCTSHALRRLYFLGRCDKTIANARIGERSRATHLRHVLYLFRVVRCVEWRRLAAYDTVHACIGERSRATHLRHVLYLIACGPLRWLAAFGRLSNDRTEGSKTNPQPVHARIGKQTGPHACEASCIFNLVWPGAAGGILPPVERCRLKERHTPRYCTCSR
jgi:hypothetical protein